MAKINLLERIVKLCSNKPVVLEIWSNNDYAAQNLKPFVDYVKNQLQEKHPGIKFLRITRTDALRNFDDTFLAGYFSGYVIQISPNLNVYELKNTCMGLERNEHGERIADIDIYDSWRGKISRKMPESHR